MNKTVKNLILIFTLLCIIVLVVFSVELILVNRDTGGKAREPAVSGNVSGNAPSGTGESDGGQASSPDDGNATSGGAGDSSANKPAQPTGEQYKLIYSNSETLVLYADEELFEHTHTEISGKDTFKYLDGGNATLEIYQVAIPLGADKRAETCINDYMDGKESSIIGMGPIKHSLLEGVYVVGVNEGETIEAWIHSIPDDTEETYDDVGLAVVVKHSNNEQKNALYAILDTLDLIPLNS
ncbi:MAG: hypothetical protein LBH28_05710 [Oscillospiraceae bacterium]|jgi:hypothetical protein|nr:hypothetical protein [Oscillospiraceae bacterium]